MSHRRENEIRFNSANSIHFRCHTEIYFPFEFRNKRRIAWREALPEGSLTSARVSFPVLVVVAVNCISPLYSAFGLKSTLDDNSMAMQNKLTFHLDQAFYSRDYIWGRFHRVSLDNLICPI